MFSKFEAMKQDLIESVDIFNKSMMGVGIEGDSIELVCDPYNNDGTFCAKVRFLHEISLHVFLIFIYPKFEYHNVMIGPDYITLMKKIEFYFPG